MPTPVDRFAENPFVESGRCDGQVVVVKKQHTKSQSLMAFSRGTGEVVDQVATAGFWTETLVDATQFVKLFVGGVRALKDLSPAGTRVFEVLYREVQQNRDALSVSLHFDMADQLTNPMSLATFKRGLKELVAKGFLAASKRTNIYWLNPAYIWNGDRLVIGASYIMQGTKAADGYRARMAEQMNGPALPFEDLGSENG